MAQGFPFRRSTANQDFPFNRFVPLTSPYRGDEDDTAQYLLEPGVNFLLPWISIPNGPAFIWPLGLQGYDLSIDPKLGIHRFIGDNKVLVEVVHKGEEHFTMTGQFLGESAPDSVRSLRDIVYADQPLRGKILYIPNLLPNAQRVAIANARFSRDDDDRGFDQRYSIEFVRTGLVAGKIDDEFTPAVPSPGASAKGGSTKKFIVNSTYNNLRKIAQLKYKDANKWRTLYSKNAKLFTRLKVPAYSAPTYKLKLGTVIYY